MGSESIASSRRSKCICLFSVTALFCKAGERWYWPLDPGLFLAGPTTYAEDLLIDVEEDPPASLDPVITTEPDPVITEDFVALLFAPVDTNNDPVSGNAVEWDVEQAGREYVFGPLYEAVVEAAVAYRAERIRVVTKGKVDVVRFMAVFEYVTTYDWHSGEHDSDTDFLGIATGLTLADGKQLEMP